MEIFGSRFGRKLQPLERNGRKWKLRGRGLPVDMGTGASRRKSQRPVMPAKRASRRTCRWAPTRTPERPSRRVACGAAPRGTRGSERSAPSLAAATARKIRRKSLKSQETGSEMAGVGRRAAESPDARVSREAPLGADARAGASFETRRFASPLRMRGLVMIAAPASAAATARKIRRKSLKSQETGSEMAGAGRRAAESPDARVSGEAPLGADTRAGASFEMRRFASPLRMRGLVMIAAPASAAATARKIRRKSLKILETGSEMAGAGRRPAKAGRPAPTGGDNGPTCA